MHDTQLAATVTKEVIKTTVVVDGHETIINNEPRLIGTFQKGDAIAQGDLYFVGIGTTVPKGCEPTTNRQLAEGDTQGSRHIAVNGNVFRTTDPEAIAKIVNKALPKRNGKTAEVQPRYIGPVYQAPSAPTENDICHPEHGNFGLAPNECAVIVYQRSLDQEMAEARVAD